MNSRVILILIFISSCCTQVICAQRSFDDIMNERMPGAISTPAGSGCSDKINQKIEEFKNEDRSNQKLLENQFKSHQEGWVEYVPGTCGAGGPPPLCPVNHWYRDPNSMQKWNQEQATVKADRENQIRQLAGNCNQAYQQEQYAQQQANDQAIIEQRDENNKKVADLLKQEADDIKNRIDQFKNQLNNLSISFGNTTDADKNLINQSGLASADNFTPDIPDETNANDLNNLKIMEANSHLFDYDPVVNDDREKCDPCFTSPTYTLQDVKDYVKDYVKEWVTDNSLEYISDKYPSLKPWYETYENYSPMISQWTSNVQSVVDINNAATCLLNKTFAAYDEGDDSQETADKNQDEFNQAFVNSLPVIGKFSKGYYTLKNIYAKASDYLKKH